MFALCHSVGTELYRQDPAEAAHQVSGIIVGVQPDEVRAQHSTQDFFSLRQKTEDLGGREGDVKKEADAGFWQPLPKQGRQKEQVVVMYPDEVIGPGSGGDLVGEADIHAPVRFEVDTGEVHVILKVVEKRPQGAVGVTTVMAASIGGRNRNRHQALLLQSSHHARVVSILEDAEPESLC